MSVTGKLKGTPVWHPYRPENGELLSLTFEYSDVIWPWSGFLAISMTVNKEGAEFEGLAQGHVSITVQSPEEEGKLFLKNLRLL